SDLNPVPFRYIDSIDSRQHIALFYEDPEYARLIEFRFIKNGLACGEHCIYATEEDSGSIVLRMLTYGIPFQFFQNGMIRVFQIPKMHGSHEEILKKLENEISRITSGVVTPFRIVSRIVSDVSTIDGISAELEIESATHGKFENFGGSLICPYDISKIESTRRAEWMKELRNNHHAIIYAPRFAQGSVFLPK
ncbi:MAG: MEDS domain-containing protein, partial [Thaumarchaeota archaeon]|nr:MEDS domain-containing protein [Nitrososphaerota archaeon]